MKRFLFFCTASLSCLAVQLSAAPAGDPLDQWHQLNPDADLYDVLDAAFGNGRWVAVPWEGLAVTSLDGTHWTEIGSFTAAGVVEFGASHWVASTTANIMVTSNDGLVWTPATWGPADYRLVDLSYGNGRWLVRGAHRGTGKEDWFWSTDEVTWEKVRTPPQGSLWSLGFGSGEWLALTVDEFFAPVLHASTDGERWTRRELPNDIGYFAFLTYGDGKWVISASPCPNCYDSTVWKSLDGVKWEKLATVASASSVPGVWLGNRWVNPRGWSANLIDWNSVPTRAIAYGQSKWMGVDDGNRLLSSTNGRQWILAKTFTGEESPTDLDFADNLWVLGGSAQSTNLYILTSPTGEAWTAAVIPAGQSGILQSLRHTSQGWAALVQSDSVRGARLLRSLDGRNWTWEALGSLPDNGFLLDLTYGNGQWLGIAASGSVVSSADLSHWQVVGSRAPRLSSLVFFCPPQLKKIEFVHGLWVAIERPECAGAGVSSILTSTDSLNWTQRYAGRYRQEIGDLTFAGGRLVAVDHMGSMLESDPLLSLELKRPGEIVVRRASGIPVVIESSDDLHQWQTRSTLPLGSALESITNLHSSSIPQRFYRAHAQ